MSYDWNKEHNESENKAFVKWMIFLGLIVMFFFAHKCFSEELKPISIEWEEDGWCQLSEYEGGTIRTNMISGDQWVDIEYWTEGGPIVDLYEYKEGEFVEMGWFHQYDWGLVVTGLEQRVFLDSGKVGKWPNCWICPKCGYDNYEGINNCALCGTRRP